MSPSVKKSEARRIKLSGTENTRDLGGWPLPGGGCTRYGAFLRSDAPFALTEADKVLLLNRGVRWVLDLRSDAEAESRSTALADDDRFVCLHVPLAGEGRIPQSAQDVPASYMEMVRGGQAMCRALEFLADAPEGALIHCIAGKDRTGVMTALLLMLAGAQEEVIAADYAISQVCLEKTLRRICRERVGLDFDVLSAREENIRVFLRLFRQNYGSAQSYLAQIGLAPEKAQRLRDKIH